MVIRDEGEQERKKEGRERESMLAGRSADCERHATIAAIDRVIETRYAVYGRGR